MYIFFILYIFYYFFALRKSKYFLKIFGTLLIILAKNTAFIRKIKKSDSIFYFIYEI